MIEFSVLASGSGGNCSYIKHSTTLMLIDCGLSYKRTKEALMARGINISDVTDIIITHAHYDHYMSLAIFIKKNKPVIHMTHKAKNRIDKHGNILFDEKINFLKCNNKIGTINVDCFYLPHEITTIGLILKCEKRKISYATDFGVATETLIKNITNSDVIVLESNHDIDMLLKNEQYPLHIKKKILGPKGHISNWECVDIVKNVYSSKTKHVICAHMSLKNNTKEKIFEAFGNLSGLCIADQELGTPVFILGT